MLEQTVDSCIDYDKSCGGENNKKTSYLEQKTETTIAAGQFQNNKNDVDSNSRDDITSTTDENSINQEDGEQIISTEDNLSFIQKRMNNIPTDEDVEQVSSISDEVNNNDLYPNIDDNFNNFDDISSTSKKINHNKYRNSKKIMQNDLSTIFQNDQKHQTASECGPSGSCDASGYCKLKTAWCPSLGEGNAKDLTSSEKISVKRIKGLEKTRLAFHAGISFPGLSNEFYTVNHKHNHTTSSDSSSANGDSSSSKKKSSSSLISKFDTSSETSLSPSTSTNIIGNITFGELLQKANLKYSDIRDTGAILSLGIFWNCDVRGSSCEPDFTLQRVDSGNGYNVKKSSYIGKKKRKASYIYGIKIVVESGGIGKKSTIVLLLIQFGSCLALLKTASMAADFLMLNCYSRQKTQMYYKCKVIETADYSDVQDRLNVVQQSEKRDAERRGAKLGLGFGGRGGIATDVLK